MTTSTIEPPRILWDAITTAAALGISQRHLADLVREGTIPSVKLGRNRRFCPEDVRAAVKNLSASS
jgi:excisionase family DNA binding protein